MLLFYFQYLEDERENADGTRTTAPPQLMCLMPGTYTHLFNLDLFSKYIPPADIKINTHSINYNLFTQYLPPAEYKDYLDFVLVLMVVIKRITK